MRNESEEVTIATTINDVTEPLLQNDEANEENSKSDSEEEDDVPSVSFFSLFRYASCKDKTLIFFSIVFALINGCMCPINTLLFSAYIQRMVDYGISVQEGKPKVDIFLEATKTFAIYNSAVAAVLVVLSYLATVFINTAAYNQVYKIRQEYLKAALNQDFEHFDTRKAGDFATKMTDHVIKLEDGIGEKLEMFIFYQASFLSSIIMALVKGWKLALLCLISFPVTMILFGIAGVIASKLSKKEAEAADRAGSVVEEVLSAIRTVYAFNGQKKEIDRYDKHLSEARNINIKKGLFEGISSGMIYLSIFSSYALSFWFGYKLMIDEPDNYDADTMIAVFLGVMMGSSNFGISSYLMEGFGVATGASAHIFYLIDNVPKINPLRDSGIVPSSIEGNIELNNVTFQYPSRPDVPVLQGVNLSVNRGQSVALVGHSGCGKSTIIQLISRYYDGIEGSVSIDGYDVRDLSVRWLRAQIGLVSQEPVLFNTTIRENIRFGQNEVSNADIEEAARQANAHTFIKKLPLGYDTLVGEKGASLSGGQKQRIAIARALVRDPHILLLDEATSALDSSSEAKVQKALDRARQGRTTIVIAHRLSTIKNVDKIYVFKDGSVIESGNHEDLMNVKGHYYDMIMLQSSPDLNEIDNQNNIYGSDNLVHDEEEDEMVEIATQEEDEINEEFEAPFTRVVQLNAPEWKSITLASVCSLTTGFAMPLLGLILSEFLSVLSNPNTEEVWMEVRQYALIFVGIGVISGLANFIMTFFYTVAGEHLTARLRKLMFVKLLELDVGFFDHKNNSTGALCARLSGEAASVQAATGQRIGTVLQGVGTLFLAVAAGIYYEWRLGLVSLSFVPPMLSVIYTEGKMVSDESSGTAKAMESSSKIAVEAVANVRTVASLGRENLFVEEYARQLQPALYIAKKATHLRGFIFGLSRGLFNFAYSATLYYGGILMVYHNIDYGIVLKCSQTLLMGSSSAATAFAYAPDFQRGLNAAGRIMLLLNRQSKITDPRLPATENHRGNGEAHFRDVLFKYPTRRLTSVLKNFNFDIKRNKTIALVGQSGCGKSTVIQLLERYYDPDIGVVAQNRIPLPMLRLGEARQCIGFVQQEPILFDRTIAENIAYGDNSRQPSMNEIIEVAKQANIHDFIISLPSGYDTNVGAKGTQLSGGQKQRVAIARALIRQPKLLLLDEATSALDTESEKVVQEALDAASAGRTCVVIAHRLSTVRDADIICMLSDGHIVECGTHDELMQLRGHYYNLNQKACTRS